MAQSNIYIQSRKHSAGRLSSSAGLVACATVLAGATLALPAQAQSAETTLKEVKVEGKADTGYTPGQLSSPKFTQPLVNTTQTVNVIKEQLLQEQGATTLTEALRNVPGAGTFYAGENGNTSTGDAVYMRGFDSSSSIYVDGVRDIGSISRDMFNIDQVEVTKGPAGTDYGRSAPTGAINLVSKQANLNNSFGGSLGLGSASYKRASIDLNRVVNAETGTAVRLNAMAQDANVAGRNSIENNRWGIAPSIAFGLNSPTRVFVNPAAHQAEQCARRRRRHDRPARLHLARRCRLCRPPRLSGFGSTRQ